MRDIGTKRAYICELSYRTHAHKRHLEPCGVIFASLMSSPHTGTFLRYLIKLAIDGMTLSPPRSELSKVWVKLHFLPTQGRVHTTQGCSQQLSSPCPSRLSSRAQRNTGEAQKHGWMEARLSSWFCFPKVSEPNCLPLPEPLKCHSLRTKGPGESRFQHLVSSLLWTTCGCCNSVPHTPIQLFTLENGFHAFSTFNSCRTHPS